MERLELEHYRCSPELVQNRSHPGRTGVFSVSGVSCFIALRPAVFFLFFVAHLRRNPVFQTLKHSVLIRLQGAARSAESKPAYGSWFSADLLELKKKKSTDSDLRPHTRQIFTFVKIKFCFRYRSNC